MAEFALGALILPRMEYPPGSETILTARDLPKPGTFRWTLNARKLFEAAVRTGLLTEEDMIRDHNMSLSDLVSGKCKQNLRPDDPGLVPQAPASTDGTLQIGGVVVFLDTKKVQVEGKQITLKPQGYGLLVALMKNKGTVVAKPELFGYIHPGKTYTQDNRKGLDVSLCALRKSLGPCKQYMRTVWGVGVLFDERKK